MPGEHLPESEANKKEKKIKERETESHTDRDRPRQRAGEPDTWMQPYLSPVFQRGSQLFSFFCQKQLELILLSGCHRDNPGLFRG